MNTMCAGLASSSFRTGKSVLDTLLLALFLIVQELFRPCPNPLLKYFPQPATTLQTTATSDYHHLPPCGGLLSLLHVLTLVTE